MAVLADLSEEERYFFAILQDQSGIDQAEFSWTDETSPDFVFRCWDFQYPWYRTRAKFQIDQCVAEGELVLTRRGHVPIEEVVVGDEVWTHRNRWRKVTYAWDKGEQDVVRVTSPLNAVGITLTPDHKLWARGGTRKMVAGVRSVHATEPAWLPPEDFAKRAGETYATMIASPHDFGCTSEVPEVRRLPRCNRDTIPSAYDEDFLWLCGIYVAEGTVRQSGSETVLSVHRDEAEQIAKTARKVGLSPRSYCATETVTQVILPGRSLAAYFQDHFGKLAHGKRLPTWALSLPDPFRQALLDGLMFGDGHIRVTRRSESLVGEYTTVSKALALDVKLLIQSLGRGANVRYARRAGQMQIQGRPVTVRDTYAVSQFVEGSRKNRIALVDEHMWASYYDIVPAGRKRVYDLEVEEDHSFIAGGIAHSNCARAIGKSVGIQMRAWAFAFTNPGEEMLITAPEMIHLDPVTKNIEDRIMSARLSREFLKKSGTSNGITHRPFEAKFRNGASIKGRIPQKDGKGVKGMHPKKLEMDEAQDYPEPGWVELGETLKYGDEDASWRSHGVSRGIRDRYYKQTQPESGWHVHRWTAMHRPDWGAEERVAKAELYGSRDHPDYRRNILGLHGDASSALFVLSRLMQCVDQNQGSYYNAEEYHHVRINDEKLRDSYMPIEELLNFPSIHQAYDRIWVGMDVGLTNHPSEILIFAEDFPTKERRANSELPTMRLKCISRVHLERISSPDQRRVLEAIWEFYRPQAISMDRTGLGLPIYQEIMESGPPGMRKAMRPYNFSEKIVIGYEQRRDEDPDSFFLEEFEPEEIKANVLEYSSDMLRTYVDQKKIYLPWDVDMLREFQGQTYVVTKSSTDAYGKKKFNMGKFHALDAARMAVLGFLQDTIVKQSELVDEAPVLDMFLV